MRVATAVLLLAAVFAVTLDSAEAVRCPKRCTTCTSDRTCTRCQIGYYVEKETNTCQVCPGRCRRCSQTNPDKCLMCIEPYVLTSQFYCVPDCPKNCINCDENGKCLECDLNYAGNSQGQCVSCGDKCWMCQLDERERPMCMLCEAPWITDSKGQCTVCPKPYVWNSKAKACKTAPKVVPGKKTG